MSNSNEASAVPQAEASQPCPCRSGALFDACCGPIVSQTRPAPTAEALMRSRYSAYTVCDAAYLLSSWAPATRPSRVRFDDDHHWRGLEIRSTTAGGLLDQSGTVEYVASYVNGLGAGAMHEVSNFVRESGKWVYVDGIHQ